jgi:hypothetical protein
VTNVALPRGTAPRAWRLALSLAPLLGCAEPREQRAAEPQEQLAIFQGSSDYCSLPRFESDVLAHVPGAASPPVDDVNWFARPIPHDGDDWIIAFASHDQNYLYNLSTDRRIKIPDRSDAVATPDGRYLTVPSYYTPDSNTRFYPVAPLLAALHDGRDADHTEPVFVHDHPAMHRVYYQSTAVVSAQLTELGAETTYRLMFSGTGDESKFRIVDYLFRHDPESGELLAVEPSEPMAVCPEVQNDLNTPFISKDGRYVASYTSPVAENAYASGASLKIYEITATDPAGGTTSCSTVADLGFVAGKADFSFDNSMLTFHSSQGAYLTPFVNGGLPEGTITDVFVARLAQDEAGRITGVSGLQRLSTSLESGVGSYFPAFFPDGNLFFLTNSVPREAESGKRFEFRVVDPASRGWRTELPSDPAVAELWRTLGDAWEQACAPSLEALSQEPFPLDPHELPLQAMSLSVPQCEALVADTRSSPDAAADLDWNRMSDLCRAVSR